MKNVSFLIVDDSPSVRSVVKSTIYNQLGSQRILSAANGLAAKLILQKQAVDIIISDLEMPHLDGFELLSFIRSHPKLKNTPFIMMTSEDSKDFVVNAIEKGVNQYLVKPFTTEKLEDAIRRSWYSAEQRRNARVFNLPPHEISLVFDEEYTTKGTINNISVSGILCELDYSEAINLFASCNINIVVKINDKKTERVKTLNCRVIRIEAQDFKDKLSRGCRVAVHVDEEANAGKTLRSLNKLMDSLTMKGLSNDVFEEKSEAIKEEF
ncbi:response regulator [Marinomonas sp. 15G1-11]|uniref:Response regulator n=1 Tax=Marinomonas phaeophyticola TaxID=3004091 RepID=A0ABT4JR42_9GAMM|nr:response regulator [Marinomonas sp. 15G1-11]MCZ2720808.1 response regulator [Marinomonas sp. 15G1-11]